MLIINKAIEASVVLKECDVFFKVTGRYPIYNIDYFLRESGKVLCDAGYGMYCDIKDHKLYDWLHLGWSGHSFECRLFGINKDFYLSNFACLFSRCNDYSGHLMEDVMFEKVKELISDKERISLRFKREPHFGGMEGSEILAASFTKKQDSMKAKVKRLLGNVFRIFLPFFYF